jgi:hypothetical protein
MFSEAQPLSLNKRKFTRLTVVRDIQQMLISSFIVLISAPTCFGFQVPSSGGYNFLIYKILQVVYKV